MSLRTGVRGGNQIEGAVLLRFVIESDRLGASYLVAAQVPASVVPGSRIPLIQADSTPTVTVLR
jgi:hypothetical protein